jgi:lipoprotein-anchoring transpeptidase ErfK/SrfK
LLWLLCRYARLTEGRAARVTLYRIHGTNEPESIGHDVSSGCIRMRNESAIDLYDRTPIGTKVIVLAMRSFGA